MTPKEKIKTYFQGLISSTSSAYDDWKEWYKRANKTGELDYKCNFKNGTCKEARKYPEHSLLTVGCCCTHCKSYKGYLEKIETAELGTYLSLWNCRTGFFRKGKGCILPRRLRSKTCLQFSCRGAQFGAKLYDYLMGTTEFETIR